MMTHLSGAFWIQICNLWWISVCEWLQANLASYLPIHHLNLALGNALAQVDVEQKFLLHQIPFFAPLFCLLTLYRLVQTQLNMLWHLVLKVSSIFKRFFPFLIGMLFSREDRHLPLQLLLQLVIKILWRDIISMLALLVSDLSSLVTMFRSKIKLELREQSVKLFAFGLLCVLLFPCLVY